MSKPFDPEDFPYTLFHDDLAPIIARLRGSSVKLLYYIMRRSRVDFTHFRRIRLGFEGMRESGLQSYATITDALQQLEELRIVTKHIIGYTTGLNRPLYEYELNLDYTITESVKDSFTEPVKAITESVKDSFTEPVKAITESVKAGVAKSTEDTRRMLSDRGAPLDHDHEEDLSLEEDLLRSDPEQVLMARLQALGQSRAQAHQLIEKQGVQNAWQWYAYVVDPENKVDSPIGYLYTAAIANASPPPLTYQVWEISQVETAYRDRQAVRAADLETARFPAAARSPDPVSPNALLWRRALDDLRMQVPSAAFGRWLAGSELVAIDGGVAMVQVGDGYAVEWLSTRWKAMILRTLSAIAGAQNPPVTIGDVQFEERKGYE
jgi:DNA-binding HxlR family transcriptional regulator